MNPLSAALHATADMATLEKELRTGLTRFWHWASITLDESPVHLTQPDQGQYSLSRNFFSTLFLYSYYRAGIPAERRTLYAGLNQCLRGMVTGCDNLLDDEYKITLDSDLPAKAHRFRSVIDIMVTDRVLFALLDDYCHQHGLDRQLPFKASAISLRALTESGVQEASEEGGITTRLPPERILDEVHRYKTGLLFQSTWAIPDLLEPTTPPERAEVHAALYEIGIACQLLDDLVDLFIDLRGQRHNYVASVITHREPAALGEALERMLVTDPTPERFYAAYPEFAARMKTEAITRLENALRQLFFPRHHQLIKPAAQFIASRIGVSCA